MKLKTIPSDYDLKGKKVLLRVDYNVPIENSKVLDDYRIIRSLKCIKELSLRGAKIILIAHIESEEKTLIPVYENLKNNIKVDFAKDFSELERGVSIMNEGDVILFENLRLDEGEKNNDELFSKMIASLGDVYINDAFSVSHRKHASVVGIPKFLPSFAGPLLEEEVNNLSTAFNPDHPFLFILGGVKFETKIPLLKNFIKIADKIAVCGALANDVYYIMGKEIGDSIHSDLSNSKELKDILMSDKIFVPSDAIVEKGSEKIEKDINEVKKGEIIYDSGKKGVAEILNFANSSKYVLWNGPLGNYEKGYDSGTIMLAKGLALLAKEKGVKVIVGGGDTVATIGKLGLEKDFSFVSTGGGAMIDFLANETLPGLDVLRV